ncbi:MAG: hypothetical protein HY290_25890 [Planctomycetia bacterium]|nr:hypothetical protein [Planctomycetia bacterium]
MKRIPQLYANILLMDGIGGLLRAVTQLLFIVDQFDRSNLARTSITVEAALLFMCPLAANLICRGKRESLQIGVVALLLTGASVYLQVEWQLHCDSHPDPRRTVVPPADPNRLFNFDVVMLVCRVVWAICYVGALFGIRRSSALTM